MLVVIALAATAAAFAAPRGDRPPNLAKAVFLTAAAENEGAVCLDGSPQSYWIQQTNSTANASKWCAL